MKKRNFVPENLNPDDEKEISRLYRALLQRDIPVNVEPLRQWILDWSELESVLGEVSCRRYVAMTDEEGRYTLSVPVFVTTLYLSTP